MKFVRKIVDLVKDNFKIKLGICIVLIVALIIVVVCGSIYSKNLNNKNLAFQVVKKKEPQKNNKVNKEIEEEKLKKEKLDEIKNKIKELDESTDLSTTEGSLDKDITYYENLYNELLRQKEEEATEKDGSTENTYYDNITTEGINNSTNNNITTPNNQKPNNQKPNDQKPNDQKPRDPEPSNPKPPEPDNGGSTVDPDKTHPEQGGEQDDHGDRNNDKNPITNTENKPNEGQ